MRFSLHDNTDWEDLGPFAETTKVQNSINKATRITITVPASNFAKFSTLDDDWVASSTAKYICVTPDGVDYSDLNSNFDTAKKLWYGRIEKITHVNDRYMIHAVEMMNRVLSEPIQLEDNIVEEVVSTSIASTTATFAAGTFTADEHNGRGALVMYKDEEYFSLRLVASDGVRYNDGGGGSGSLSSTYNDDNTFWTCTSGIQANQVDFDDRAMLEFDFFVDWHPKLPITIEFEVNHGWWSGYNTIDPGIIQVYNYDTSTWDTLVTMASTEDFTATATAIYPLIINDMAYVRREANIQILVRLVGEHFQHTGGDYNSNIAIDYAGLQRPKSENDLVYKNWPYHKFDPFVVKITDTTTTQLTISPTDGLIDKHANDVSTFQILYKHDEWLEDIIDASPYTRMINAINAPTSNVPTYYVFDFNLVGANFKDICEAEKWYFYQTRKTTSSKPDIDFKEKSSPPWHGLVIEDENIDLSKTVDITYDANQKYRGVIIWNGENYKCKGIDGASTTQTLADIDVTDLKLLVLTRKDIPDNLLQDVADAIYDANSSMEPQITCRIRSVHKYSENFRNHDVGDQVTEDASWTALAGDDYNGVQALDRIIATKSGKRWLKIEDEVNGLNVDVEWDFPDDLEVGESLSFKVFPETGTDLSDYMVFDMLEGGTRRILWYIRNGDGSIAYNDGTVKETGLSCNLDEENEITVTVTSTTTFTITVNGVTSSSLGVNSTISSKIDSMAIKSAELGDDITMWFTEFELSSVDGEFNIHETNDDDFFVGCGIDFHYQEHVINTVVRDIKWNHDNSADLILGFDDNKVESIKEIVQRLKHS